MDQHPCPTLEESIQYLEDTCDVVRCALIAALVYGEKGGTICNANQTPSCGTHG